MKYYLESIIESTLEEIGYLLPGKIEITKPPKTSAGDWATNIALILASNTGEKPYDVAVKIAESLRQKDSISKVEIAGPGFINIFLDEKRYKAELKEMLRSGPAYGRGESNNIRVNVEYVSANPTGPLHVGNARGGPIGETLANIYEFRGYKVTREFYVNDIGGQANRFGESLYYWYARRENPSQPFPEGGYPGEYVKEISDQIVAENLEELSGKNREGQVELFKAFGIKKVIEGIRADLELIGIDFDVWYYQSDLALSEKTKRVVEMLEEKGKTVSKDGAFWFQNPADPDLADCESVLIKTDGSYTYYADDIAYHKDKIDRGFDLLVDVWGANHFGHIPRMEAALRALGYSEKSLKIILYQYIRLKKSGRVVSMGKRLGNFVTLREVVEAGVEGDAYKYFVLAQNMNTPFDFDIELAADRSEKNPVYYIKYAHARICSILRKAGEDIPSSFDGQELTYSHEKEKALMRELTNYSELVRDTLATSQIQALPQYAYRIASLFHEFYDSCKVLDTAESERISRLALIIATKNIIASCLNICGIEAPEKM